MRRPVVLEIVVPVLNEAHVVERSVLSLRAFADSCLPFSVGVTVVDNGSEDGTWDIVSRLARAEEGVDAVHLSERGRGRALRYAWSTSPAAIVAYTDVDLSTGLDALLPLVAPLLSGHSDLAIGTRLAVGAHVVRSRKRETISRAYNLLIRLSTGHSFSDAQCGFKALRADVARDLLPRVRDEEWFFDTELLMAAEDAGFRIHEVPVDWVEDPDSRVDIPATALADLRGLWRVVRHRPPRGESASGVGAGERRLPSGPGPVAG